MTTTNKSGTRISSYVRFHCLYAWKWKNCPIAWKGQFCRGDHRNLTIILKVVTSQDLWIYHAFFGNASSNNDITVLNGSNVFDEVLSGHVLTVQYTVNRIPI